MVTDDNVVLPVRTVNILNVVFQFRAAVRIGGLIFYSETVKPPVFGAAHAENEDFFVFQLFPPTVEIAGNDPMPGQRITFRTNRVFVVPGVKTGIVFKTGIIKIGKTFKPSAATRTAAGGNKKYPSAGL